MPRKHVVKPAATTSACAHVLVMFVLCLQAIRRAPPDVWLQLLELLSDKHACWPLLAQSLSQHATQAAEQQQLIAQLQQQVAEQQQLIAELQQRGPQA